MNFFNKKRGEYLIIIKLKKEIAGFLLILKNKNNFVIDLVAVKKKFKKLGYASKMLNFFNHHIIKNKNIFLYASTQSSNVESLKFYKKNNFKIKSKEHIYHLTNFAQ